MGNASHDNAAFDRDAIARTAPSAADPGTAAVSVNRSMAAEGMHRTTGDRHRTTGALVAASDPGAYPRYALYTR